MTPNSHQLSIALLFCIGTASHAGEWCSEVAEELATTTNGPVRLYASSQYAWDYDDIGRIVSMDQGISCSHTKPAPGKELLACANDLRATGVTQYRPCTFQEEYGVGISNLTNRLTCAIYRGRMPETNWVVMDKLGQHFADYNESWKSVSPSKGCLLGSSGKYEERGYKFLRLTAGDTHLYFVREELSSYSHKRQPAL